MLGAVITFLVVCAIFGIYMSIVHSFLRAAEEPDDVARGQREREARAKELSRTTRQSPHERQWAH